MTLQPGEVKETVEVTGAMPLLESSSSAIGQVIENKNILELPLNGRNPFALGLLAGNTTPMFGMGSNLPFIGGGGRFSSNEVMLDGIDNNTSQNAGAVGRAGIAYTPSLMRSRSSRSRPTTSPRSSDTRPDRWPRRPSSPARTASTGPSSSSCGTTGWTRITFSPIRRDNRRASSGRTRRARRWADESSATGRSGSPTSKSRGSASRHRVRFSTPFPNNRIPNSQINATSKAVTDLVPLPNFGAAGALARNFFRQHPNQFRGDRGDLRIDHRLTAANSIYARYSLWNQRQPIPGGFEGSIGGGSRRIDFSRHAVLGDTHIFSPSVVNEFRFGFVRHNGSDAGDAPSGVPFAQAIDTRDRGSLFDIKTGRFQLPGQNGFSRAIVEGDHNNIGPRFGFAYQKSQRIVIRGGYGIFYGMRDQNQETSQFSGNNPNVPTLTFPVVDAQRTAAPPFTINTPVVAAPSDTTLASFSADRPFVRTIRTQAFNGAKYPLLHQANVSLQWEPKANWLLEMTLSASRGRDLATAFLHSNQVPFEYALDGRNVQRFRPFPHVNGTVPTVDSTGTSSYHAMNLKVEKRYSSGVSFLLKYTIQKNMETNGTGPSSFTQNGGTSFVFDHYNLSRERAVAPIDVPQIFVASYGYEVPFLKRNKWLGGWQVNGITTVRGGFPSDLRTNVLAPIFNTFNLPDAVPGAKAQVQSGRSVDNFFDPAAFKVPGTVRSAAGANVTLLGNSARRNVRGPGSVNADFSAFKNTMITERYSLQFRAEFFNLTNTPAFFLPSASSNNLTCIGPAGGACNAGNPNFGRLSNGTATGRQIQFGLKFLF